MGDIHSTGRGGAGNIGHDDTTYIDASIVREGVTGETDRAQDSAGRGGAGNMIGSPRNASPAPPSKDYIPETAMREKTPDYADFHTGRGGGGNVHREKYGGHSAPQDGHKESLLDKARHAVGLDRHKVNEGSALKNETTS